MTIRCLLPILILLPVLLKAQIPNEQVPAHVAKYFNWNRLAPELVSTDLFVHPEVGYVLKVKINARRTSGVEDLIYAFTAAAAVANLARSEIELLWVEMCVQYKEIETTMAVARADCSIEAIIFQSIGPEIWWVDCLEICELDPSTPIILGF